MHAVTSKIFSLKTFGIAGVLCLAILTMGSSCGGTDNSGQANENKAKLSTYNKVIKNQPNPGMDYSPTRQTIIEWAKYWRVPGRLAYTYITDGPNDFTGGYYVFVGPPVSNCVGLTNPEQKVHVDGDSGSLDTFIPAPGIDSVYGGGDCTEHYGIDATTHLPVAFSVGMGQNMQYFAQPNQRYTAKPLGDATFASAKKP